MAQHETTTESTDQQNLGAESPGVHHSIDQRSGASSQPDAFDEDVEELPQVVWLRGEEKHCAEFSMDAEQVMETLGIKRSRLTQISGKELRVGRIRVDRYIKPMYRPEDVMEYQQWTRATASSAKSKHILQKAAEELRHGSKDFAEQIDKGLSAAQEKISNSLSEVCSETYQIQKQSVLAIEQRLVDFADRIQKNEHDIKIQIEELRTVFAQFLQSQAQVLEPIERIHSVVGGIEELRHAADESYRLIFESQASQKESLDQHGRFHRNIAEALGKIIDLQRKVLLISQSMQNAQQLSSSVAAQAPNLKTSLSSTCMLSKWRLERRLKRL